MSSGKYNLFYLWRSEVRSEGGPGPQFSGSSRRKSFLSHPPSPFSSTLLEVTPHMAFPLLPTLLPMGGAREKSLNSRDVATSFRSQFCYFTLLVAVLSFIQTPIVRFKACLGNSQSSYWKTLYSFQNLSPGRVTFTGPRDLDWACFGRTSLTPCVEEGSCWLSDEYLGVYHFCLFLRNLL